MKTDRNFVPYPFYWDDAPIDLTFMFKDEKPAGKHGFARVEGEKFVFDDGTEARFWGTNFNSGANFPEHADSEKIAARLAKFGVNIVRFHQLDADWSIPNIFQFSRGERLNDTLELDPISMDRLDWLVHCLKNHGIYIYIDLLTYRRFRDGDGVRNAGMLKDAAKPFCLFDRRLIELQKKFCRDLFNHVNPYTGLAYKDEPAIVMTEIVNEVDLFCRIEVEPYKSDFEERFSAWRREQTENENEEKLLYRFKVILMREYFEEMKTCIVETGVRIPIAGTNWGPITGAVLSQNEMDFYDSHGYWLDQSWTFWGEKEKKLYEKSIVDHSGVVFPAILLGRVLGKPFVVSEWDEPWPIEWRGESVPYLAGVSGLQGWSAVIIHTYRYGTSRDVNIIGKEMSSSAIGGTPYREGMFSTFNDPAKFGLFYHAAIMQRRGDVREAQKSLTIETENPGMPYRGVPAFSSPFDELHKTGMKLCAAHPRGDENVEAEKEYKEQFKGSVLSDTKEIYRSWQDRLAWIDTDKTKIVYGFIDGRDISLSGMSVRAENDFAVVALSSLDGRPVCKSDNMLLTTVARAENTDMKFNEERTRLLDFGRAPICIEAVEADIKLRTDVSGLRVLSINAEGFITGEIPSEYIDGQLCFKTGQKFVSMYYLIQRL